MPEAINDTESLFHAIEQGDAATVRALIAKDRDLTKAKRRGEYKYPKDFELDAFKFLGAYIGSLTGLQYAVLTGHDKIAHDIIDAMFKEDLDEKCGGNNTALHLATLLGSRDIVKQLLERGADRTIKNSKNFTPIDVVDDADMQALFTTTPVSP
ncbi:hypothetical protein GGF32_009701 [Allomyces javanicus]|nr:hypothetical protein GGF32_009701 [Allomyces javanicus]